MEKFDYQTWQRATPKVRSLLRLYKAIGVEELFVPELRQAIMEGPPKESAAGTVPPKTSLLDTKSVLDAGAIDQLKSQWGECVRCALHKSRKHLVLGEGNPKARLVFVGEGPGAEEDKAGRPFVGKAGQLLTDIIEKGFKLKRSDVYITNVVKCRPPENRNPQPEEIKTCMPLLWKQLEIIDPDIICALGKIATQALLDSKEPISSLRGQFQKVRNYVVMPTYHPAYLLRSPDKKRETWQDVKAILKAFSPLK